jgi:signal transduction histidine kinase
MAPALLIHGPMAEARAAGVRDAGPTRDLGLFNHWLNLTRIRATVSVAIAVVVLDWLHPETFEVEPVLAICAAGIVFSLVGLRWRALHDREVLLFAGQTAFDLLIVTVGLAVSTHGLPAILFRALFVLVITPVCLVTVPGGLTVVAAATLAHLGLLGLERGFTAETLLGIEALVQPILFLLVAQQCFFYGSHLEQKNRDLAALAASLDEHRRDLADEARTSATLVEVARTLGSTLEAGELLARTARTMGEYLGADWGTIFLVDREHGTFRLAAATDGELPVGELGRIDFPLSAWPDLARLERERIVLLERDAASRVPMAFRGKRPLATVLLAGLHRGETLAGFLAVGYQAAAVAAPTHAQRLVAGIAEHAAIVLHNARLLDEVRLAASLKSEFVGAVSHELRSPLNVIIGYAEMLREGALGRVNPEQATALERTHKQAVTLLEMITALLDLNRLEAGRLPVSRAPVDVPALLEEVIDEVPDGWRRPNVRLYAEASPGVPVVSTDRGKLKTVLRNLVHNALKFTPAGEVVIAASATRLGGVTMSVRDTGVGIPPDALPYVFEMFRQVPGAGGGGVGLGLHIVRRFVDALGGRVDVTSRVGRGTTFTDELPPPAVDEPARAA